MRYKRCKNPDTFFNEKELQQALDWRAQHPVSMLSNVTLQPRTVQYFAGIIPVAQLVSSSMIIWQCKQLLFNAAGCCLLQQGIVTAQRCKQGCHVCSTSCPSH
jgi:hypothetical protein